MALFLALCAGTSLAGPDRSPSNMTGVTPRIPRPYDETIPRDHSRPFILAIVDMAIGLAAARLAMVQQGLDTYGPDAMLIG